MFVPSIVQDLKGKVEVHPYYAELAPYWDFLRVSFLGGEAWATQGKTWTHQVDVEQVNSEGTYNKTGEPRDEWGHLWRHPREEDWAYRARRRAATYTNFVEPAVKTLARYVTRGVTGPTFPPALSELSKDVDLRGTDVPAFRDAMVTWADVYGHIHVLWDKTRSAAELQSRAEELEQGIRAYAQLVSPLDLLNWSVQPNGEYAWALVRVRRASSHEYGDSVDAQKLVTRLYTPEGWKEFESGSDEPVDEGPGFGFVPLVTVFADRDPLEPEPIGVSPIRDIAYLARKVFNKASWQTEDEWASCFNQAVIHTPDKATAKTKRVYGTSRYIHSEGGASMLHGDTTTMQHLMDSQRADIAAARETIGLDADKDKAGVESASALVMRREGLDAILSGSSTRFESGEKRVWSMGARIESVKDWEPDVKYQRDYTRLARFARSEGIQGALEKSLFAGAAKAELQTELIQALLPDMAEDVRTKILAAIQDEVKKAEEQAAATKQAMLTGAQKPQGEGDAPEDEEQADGPNGKAPAHGALLPGKPAVQKAPFG